MLHAEGPLLEVNLRDQTTTVHEIDDLLSEFIGGRGLATKLAHDRIPFDADPLGANNRAYLSTGPLQVSRMSFTGRMNMTALSPLTDGLLSTNAGGYLSRNFADTGFSAVELTGTSEELIAIHVSDEGVEFEPVPDLEQAEVPAVTRYMERRHGLEDEHLVTIGPGGENLVRFACVMTYDSRAFGRGGLGAVLGSKNVKCLSFRGDSRPEVDLPDDLEMEIHRSAATTDDMMKRQGTTAGTETINEQFSLPTRYFSEYSFEHAADIGGDAVEAKKYEKAACSVCAFACKLPTRDEAAGVETEGPEYETVFSFGSNQGVGDVVEVMKANELCDRYGLDTISCGNVIAAYLAANDEFGNAELAQELVGKIAFREDEGDRLAEGVQGAAEHLGVEDYSVKGMDFAAHDGRVLQGTGLSYAVANRGGDHMYSVIHRLQYNGELDPNGTADKPGVLVRRENYCAIRDSAIICAFSDGGYIDPDHLEGLLQTDWDDLQRIGSRVVDLERHFFNQRGVDTEADRLPYDLPDLEESLARYYDLRGWTDDGVVPDERIAG